MSLVMAQPGCQTCKALGLTVGVAGAAETVVAAVVALLVVVAVAALAVVAVVLAAAMLAAEPPSLPPLLSSVAPSWFGTMWLSSMTRHRQRALPLR